MRVKIIRHWGKGNKEHGEYLVEDEMGETLVFQNGDEYKAIEHYIGKPIRECIEPIKDNVIALIKRAIEEKCAHLKFSTGGVPYIDTSKYYEIGTCDESWYEEGVKI